MTGGGRLCNDIIFQWEFIFCYSDFCGQMVRVWEKDVAYVGEVVSLQCALDPYDVGVTILYAEGAINERLASFDWELVDVQ